MTYEEFLRFINLNLGVSDFRLRFNKIPILLDTIPNTNCFFLFFDFSWLKYTKRREEISAFIESFLNQMPADFTHHLTVPFPKTENIDAESLAKLFPSDPQHFYPLYDTYEDSTLLSRCVPIVNSSDANSQHLQYFLRILLLIIDRCLNKIGGFELVPAKNKESDQLSMHEKIANLAYGIKQYLLHCQSQGMDQSLVGKCSFFMDRLIINKHTSLDKLAPHLPPEVVPMLTSDDDNYFLNYSRKLDQAISVIDSARYSKLRHTYKDLGELSLKRKILSSPGFKNESNQSTNMKASIIDTPFPLRSTEYHSYVKAILQKLDFVIEAEVTKNKKFWNKAKLFCSKSTSNTLELARELRVELEKVLSVEDNQFRMKVAG